MSKQNKYKALIIGAGKIAGGYDQPKSSGILTHAHAYKKHGRTELLGFYDIDFQKAKQAAKKWSCEAFRGLNNLVNGLFPDIISICIPDKEHFGTLKMITGLKKKPKLVICEKPITTKIEDTEKIVRLYQRKKIPLLVDHTRRFDLAVQRVAKEIKNKRFGKVVNASAIYSNGVLHSGIHIIDLARFFFGEVKKFRTLYSIKDRGRGTDKTVGAFIEFENCRQFYLMTSDERNFCFAEFDILCEKGRFRFIDLGFGLAEQKAIASPIYKGDIILGKPILKKTNFDKALLGMIDNAVGYLESGEPLLCDAIDAGKTQKVCLSLLKSVLVK